jgi:hypothetical protein
MKVPRMPVGMLESETAFAEIDLAGNSRVHHPLQRTVDGGPADAAIFLADEIDEIVSTQVPFLAEKGTDDEIALAGPFAASRAHAIDINGLHALQMNPEKE